MATSIHIPKIPEQIHEALKLMSIRKKQTLPNLCVDILTRAVKGKEGKTCK